MRRVERTLRENRKVTPTQSPKKSGIKKSGLIGGFTLCVGTPKLDDCDEVTFSGYTNGYTKKVWILKNYTFFCTKKSVEFEKLHFSHAKKGVKFEKITLLSSSVASLFLSLSHCPPTHPTNPQPFFFLFPEADSIPRPSVYQPSVLPAIPEGLMNIDYPNQTTTQGHHRIKCFQVSCPSR